MTGAPRRHQGLQYYSTSDLAHSPLKIPQNQLPNPHRTLLLSFKSSEFHIRVLSSEFLELHVILISKVPMEIPSTLETRISTSTHSLSSGPCLYDECFHSVRQHKGSSECVLSAVGARSCGNQRIVHENDSTSRWNRLLELPGRGWPPKTNRSCHLIVMTSTTKESAFGFTGSGSSWPESVCVGGRLPPGLVDIGSGGGWLFAWKVRSRAAPTVSRCFRESVAGMAA